MLALNGLGWSALIFPGQVLTLGTRASSVAVVPVPAVSFEIARYTIQDGDTISGIAAAKGLSANAVLSANGLDRSSILFPGQVIVLPNTATPAAPVPRTSPGPGP